MCSPMYPRDRYFPPIAKDGSTCFKCLLLKHSTAGRRCVVHGFLPDYGDPRFNTKKNGCDRFKTKEEV